MRSILELVASADTTEIPALEVEYRALTHACGLIDRSERGKLALTGPGAVEFLNGQVTNELALLHCGEGCYAAFLTHKGKMLGDLRILAVGERAGGAPSELLLDTERVALQALFDMIHRFRVGYEMELIKRTLQNSLFSLVGPGADAVIARALAEGTAPQPAPADGSAEPGGEPPALPATEHAHRSAVIAGRAVR